MKKLIAMIANQRWYRLLTVVVLGLTVFWMQAFANTSQAFAEETVKSPAGYYYKGAPSERISSSDREISNQQKSAIDQDRNENQAQKRPEGSLDNLGGTVKSPYGYYYKGTPEENFAKQGAEGAKDFLKSAKEKVGEAVESITGKTQQ